MVRPPLPRISPAMSRCASLDPVDGSWLPPAALVVGSQIVVVVGAPVVVGVVVVDVDVVVGDVVVVVVVVVGRVGLGRVVVGAVVGGSVVAGAVVGGSVVGSTLMGGSVVGPQIVAVVASSVSSIPSSASSVVPGSPIMVVAGRRLVVGWAAWRRTGAVRTTLRGLTLAHSLVRCRSLPPAPSFQALATFAHDLARRRSLAQLPFLQALVGRRSLADSPCFQALAVECAWSLPLDGAGGRQFGVPSQRRSGDEPGHQQGPRGDGQRRRQAEGGPHAVVLLSRCRTTRRGRR
jgi:hypothetical protein